VEMKNQQEHIFLKNWIIKFSINQDDVVNIFTHLKDHMIILDDISGKISFFKIDNKNVVKLGEFFSCTDK
jgi:hypothetical protein